MAILKKITLAAAAFAATAGVAGAADIIEPPVYEAPPEVAVVAAGGWYLRGDIGMSNQQLHGGLSNVLFADPDNFEFLDKGTFSSAPTFRGGIGYQFNNWLRADATVEYRGKASFNALDRYETVDDGNPATWDGTNEYEAKKSEWLLMANAYVDLGTWAGITPYAGFGLGASRNTISSFRDINTPNGGVAYGGQNSEWNLAWALHAGVAMDITERLTMDLGYSYLNMGDASSGDIVPFQGANAINNPMKFEDITSHDVKFGLRYKLH